MLSVDVHYDEAWCPVCDRQIIPKRYTVPVQPHEPQRTKANKGKGGGLAHGTGHIRPAVDSNPSKNRSRSPPSQQPPSKSAPQPKLRTVIDQGPIPLYCSDECRFKDLARLDGAFSIDYNPNSASPPFPPVPHNSFDRSVHCESEDESSGPASVSLESRSSSSDSGPVSPSLTTLSAIYGFPPLPPAPPILPTSNKPESSPEPQHLHDYQSGVMMSAKRIEAALCVPQSTKRPFFNQPQPPRKPIPGWTDGSQDWRESVYSFSPRPSSITTPGLEARPSFAASSHRGVQWSSSNPDICKSPSSLPRSSRSEADQLDVKAILPLSRRPDSRTSFTPSTSCPSESVPPLSPTSTTSSRRRRDNLLAKAGGRLLVPNVTVPPHSSSSQSVSSCISSPFSRYPSEVSEDSMLNEERSSSGSAPSQPSVSVRSWSYDNVRTYPVMMPPPKKEKRIVTRVIDGETEEVEVEVEVTPQVKRLFLFAGKEVSCEQPQY
ncbi:hypothetical protein BKA82DRAFT_809051 [Pisolithus tinctorius]|uniref:Uncharacterized protein n=1 Tax=Pisolithus tinctorius Marx 270 TaxID=870435 RepID=A0A0C3NW70_PISTI|nr:hypothetical protein BKA82DRAFT_809051 [Pisolithus tinctorius]KIN99635.1 hypothetical protein M404DRAFT_809051 [Pisolithus tinctorius Marx 270]